MKANKNEPPKRGRLLKIMAAGVALLFLAFIAWVAWTHSDAYRIRAILSEAPSVVDQVMSAGSSGDKRGELMTGAPEVVVLGEEPNRYSTPIRHYEVMINWARALAHANKLDESLEVANKIDDYYYKALAYARIAGALAQVGNVKETQRFADLANNAVEDVDKRNRVSIFIEIAKALSLAKGAAGDADEAWAAANTAIDDQPNPHDALQDFNDYMAIAIGMDQFGKADKAMALWDAAEVELHSLLDQRSKNEAIITFSKAAVKAGKMDSVLRIADEMLSGRPAFELPGFFGQENADFNHNYDLTGKDIALLDIAEIFIEAGKKDEAAKLSKDALDKADQLRDFGKPKNLHLPGQMALIYARLVKILLLVDNTGMADKALESFFQSINELEKGKSGKELSELQKFSNWDAPSNTKIAVTLALAGKVDAAFYLIQKMLESGWRRYKAENLTNWSERSFWTILAIANALAERGQINEAHDVMNRYKELVAPYGLSKVDEYSLPATIAKELARQGKTNDALDVIQKIEDLSLKDKARLYFVQETNDFAQRLLQEGQKDAGKQVLMKALDAAHQITDEDLKLMALSNVAKGYARFSDYQRAREFCKDSSPVDKLDVYAVILNKYANAPEN
jgi:hypothetical protein